MPPADCTSVSPFQASLLQACACLKSADTYVLCDRACRHGDRCSRLHNRPTISPTLLLPNLYQNPALNAPPGPDGLPMPVDARKSQEHFEVCCSWSLLASGSSATCCAEHSLAMSATAKSVAGGSLVEHMRPYCLFMHRGAAMSCRRLPVRQQVWVMPFKHICCSPIALQLLVALCRISTRTSSRRSTSMAR